MPRFSSTIKDPWEIEHEHFLQLNPNAIAHSDTIYTGVVHKGFDADDTAVELIRRYPAFEETEQHREFLVHSINERLALPGETDNYFTPEQLWQEENRLAGKWYLPEEEIESCSSDEESISDETPADAELVYSAAITAPESRKDEAATNASGLPIMLQTSGDHTTTITRNYADVQLLLHTLDISLHDALPLRAIAQRSADGSLVLALLGHLQTDTSTTCNRRTAEKKEPACCNNEWHLVCERPQQPAMAFFSGTETCSDLVEEIRWKPESIAAASLVFGDRRVLVLLVGRPAEEAGGLFDSLWKGERVPAEHEEISGLLEVAQRELIVAGGL
jgi:hypothetical protein